MTKKFRFHLDIGYHNAEHEAEFEITLPDGSTPEQFEAEAGRQAKEWSWNYIEVWTEEVK